MQSPAFISPSSSSSTCCVCLCCSETFRKAINYSQILTGTWTPHNLAFASFIFPTFIFLLLIMSYSLPNVVSQECFPNSKSSIKLPSTCQEAILFPSLPLESLPISQGKHECCLPQEASPSYSQSGLSCSFVPLTQYSLRVEHKGSGVGCLNLNAGSVI